MSGIMLGPSFGDKGGVAAVVNVYKKSGLIDKYGITYLPTTLDGNMIKKICLMLFTWLKYIRKVLYRDTCFIHIHIASRNSTWRKLLFILPAIMFKKKYILHLHGAEYKKFYYDECGIIKKNIVRWIFKMANSIIVLSSQWKEIVLSFSDNPRIFVIHNPVEIGNMPLYANRPDFNIVFLGRLGKRKGIFDLLEALKSIINIFPNVRLICGGDGDIKAVMTAVENATLNNNFQYLGWINGKEKIELMEKADVFVLPSYNEGLPVSVLEALAHGVPVISTLVGGIPDAIEDGKDGYLIEPGNITKLAEKIMELVKNGELRKEMSQLAYKKAYEKFSIERIIPNIEAVYDELR